MKREWFLVGVAGAVLLTACAYGSYLNAKRAAADRATIDAHERTIATLRTQSAKLDTIYLRDTLTLTKWRNNWDALAAQWRAEQAEERDTSKLYLAESDTISKLKLADTVTVERLIAVADTTIRACTQALRTCEAQQAVLRSIIGADSTTIRALSRDLSRAKIRNRLGCSVGPSWNPKGSAYVGVSCGLNLRF